MSNSKPIVVRMAPSPTGNLHVGTARTTLFNYLFAKHTGGKFILRIEDTDKERSKPEFEKNIIDGLHWLGLSWDEFYRQSEREEIYVSYLQKLIDSGHAYVSKEEVKEEGQRAEVIRFKNPNKLITFEDLIRGEVTFNTEELGDFVIARSMSEPLYHLAVVIDDHEMGVTHVIRGEDHISNTPRQILIQEAIGAPRPIYAHLPLILDTDRKKLSKRAHGASVWIDSYKQDGYLPEALNNFFALMGWNPGGEKEVFTLDELCSIFEIEKTQKGGAIFNKEKLNWFNKEHMKRMGAEALNEGIEIALKNSKKLESKTINATLIRNVISTTLERVSTLSEITILADAGEFDYFLDAPVYEKDLLFWKEEKDSAITKRRIEKVIEILSTIGDDTFTADTVKTALWDYATEEGRGQVLWPMRVALSGKEKSPDPFILSGMLGKTETVARLRTAEQKLV